MCKYSGWVQFWASNNFTRSSPCSQVCKGRWPTPARAGSNKAFLPRTGRFTPLSVINLHSLLTSVIRSALSITSLRDIWPSDPWLPLPSHSLPLFESHWVCFTVLVGSYLPSTYHGISPHRAIKAMNFCSLNHGNFCFFRSLLFIIQVDPGHSKLSTSF